MKPVRFNLEQAQQAVDEWGFNCGPAALCAVLDKTPAEIRPHLLDFESKGYTSPTLMTRILDALGAQWVQTFRGDDPFGVPCFWPGLSLMRVQWGGRWTQPGVPMRVRYRYTHWVGVSVAPDETKFIFDTNAICCGGWLPVSEWADKLVPWLIKEGVPKGSGAWWPTHVLALKSSVLPAGKKEATQ